MIIINGWKSGGLIIVAGVIATLIMKMGSGGLGVLVMGILLTVGGFHINKPYVDDEGNVMKPRQGVFWIPIQYWGILLGLLGFIGLLQGK